MSVIDAVVRVVHVLFAGVWAGGTLLMSGIVVPAARDGRLSADGFEWILDRFTYLTLAAVALLFVTGGHLAGTGYTVGSLLGSGRGHLVLAMLSLWLVLAGLLHVGTRAIRNAIEDGAAAAAAAGQSWYVASGAVAAALLVVAGLL